MKLLKTLVTGAVLSATLAATSFAAEYDVNATTTGLAMRGFDPVSYFADGAPSEGDWQITAVYKDATYRFANEENKVKFEADPEAYAPAYGGYCAFGTAMGVKVDGDPELWAIVDDKLYLNLSEGIQERWVADTEGFIEKADMKWIDIEHSDPAALNQ